MLKWQLSYGHWIQLTKHLFSQFTKHSSNITRHFDIAPVTHLLSVLSRKYFPWSWNVVKNSRLRPFGVSTFSTHCHKFFCSETSWLKCHKELILKIEESWQTGQPFMNHLIHLFNNVFRHYRLPLLTNHGYHFVLSTCWIILSYNCCHKHLCLIWLWILAALCHLLKRKWIMVHSLHLVGFLIIFNILPTF